MIDLDLGMRLMKFVERFGDKWRHRRTVGGKKTNGCLLGSGWGRGRRGGSRGRGWRGGSRGRGWLGGCSGCGWLGGCRGRGWAGWRGGSATGGQETRHTERGGCLEEFAARERFPIHSITSFVIC